MNQESNSLTPVLVAFLVGIAAGLLLRGGIRGKVRAKIVFGNFLIGNRNTIHVE